jgi:hypothetical protein
VTAVDHAWGTTWTRALRRLGDEVSQLAQPEPGILDRPVALQRALIDVIDALDPDRIRLPQKYLKRLGGQTPARPPEPTPQDANVRSEPRHN